MGRSPRSAVRAGAAVGGALMVAVLAVAPIPAGAAPRHRQSLVADVQATASAGSARENIIERVEVDGITVTSTGTGVFATSGEEGSFSLTTEGQTYQLLADSGTLYLKPPASALAALGAATPWVSLDVDALAHSTLGVSYQSLLAEGSNSPAQQLAILEHASTDGVTEVGTATVGGVATTEYRAEMSLAKGGAAEGGPATATALAAFAAKYHLSNVPVTVWVDAEHRVRQLTEHFDLPASGSLPATSVTSTVGMDDFGVPVDVTPPPADQVTDLTAQALAAG